MRKEFLDYFCRQGYEELEEKPIGRGANTYFIMSPIAAHLDLFEKGNERLGQKYCIVQRTFCCDKIDGSGDHPLATPYEVMGSFFRFADESPAAAIRVLFQMLSDLLGISQDALYFRTSDQLGIVKSLLECGAKSENVIVWKSLKPLSLGHNRPTGEYLHVYFPYRHGIVPIATLGFLSIGSTLAVDSSFSIERFVMLNEKKLYLPMTSIYTNLWNGMESFCEEFKLSQEDKYLWIYFTRAVTALLWDGVSPANHYSGHFIKKMIRRLAYSLIGKAEVVTYKELNQLVNLAATDLERLSYLIPSAEREKIIDTFYQRLATSQKQIHASLNHFRELLRGKTLDEALAEQGSGEMGLAWNWMIAAAAEIGSPISAALPPSRYSLKNVGYPFYRGAQVDIKGLICESEKEYAARN